MKILQVVGPVMLMLLSNLHAQTWEKVNMTFPAGDTLRKYSVVAFATKDIGWNFSGMSSSDHHIFKTTDGGYHWARLSDEISVSSYSRICVSDSLHCWTLSVNGYLTFTTDGGDTWQWGHVPFTDNAGDCSAFTFRDSLNGFAFNRFPWMTSDGGISWTKSDSFDLEQWRMPLDAAFGSSSRVWVVGEAYGSNGFVANTSDGGKTWQFQDHAFFDSTTLMTPELLAVDFADSLNGFAVGRGEYWDYPYILSTTDGGSNWKRQQFDATGLGNDIGFLNKDTGWIPTTEGRICKTTDGGGTWNIQSTGVSGRFAQIIVLRKEKVAYIFGDNYYNEPPFILLRADLNNLDGARQFVTQKPKGFVLLQNYPNPFNSQTVIEYTLKEQSLTQLKIFNILGCEVKTLLNSTQNAGKHKLVWDGTDQKGGDVPTGVYTCRLLTNFKTSSTKLLKIK